MVKKHSIRIKNKNSNRVHVVNNIHLASTGKKKRKSGAGKKPTAGHTHITVNVPSNEPAFRHPHNPFHVESSHHVPVHVPVPEVVHVPVPEVVRVPHISSEETALRSSHVVIKRKRLNAKKVPDATPIGSFTMPTPRESNPFLSYPSRERPLSSSQINPMLVPEVSMPISSAPSSSSSRAGEERNPLTGRWVKTGGTTWKKLKKDGFI